MGPICLITSVRSFHSASLRRGRNFKNRKWFLVQYKRLLTTTPDTINYFSSFPYFSLEPIVFYYLFDSLEHSSSFLSIHQYHTFNMNAGYGATGNGTSKYPCRNANQEGHPSDYVWLDVNNSLCTSCQVSSIFPMEV